jgi:hypothetical protein
MLFDLVMKIGLFGGREVSVCTYIYTPGTVTAEVVSFPPVTARVHVDASSGAICFGLGRLDDLPTGPSDGNWNGIFESGKQRNECNHNHVMLCYISAA